MKIGLFDSGVGGLTVLNRLVNKYPNNEYIYYGDTLNMPYGNKNIDELEEYSSNIIDFLINKNVDIIVIACGTISSNLGLKLKNKYSTKMVDIITPTINYINKSNYNRIGVIATTSTIESKVFSNNLNKDVKEVACKEFVPIIESNNLNNIDKYMDYYLSNLKDRELIILGCTHYPIIKDKIYKYFNSNIKLLDMSECLFDNFSNDSKRKIELYFSKLNDNVKNNIHNILNFDDYIVEEIKE